MRGWIVASSFSGQSFCRRLWLRTITCNKPLAESTIFIKSFLLTQGHRVRAEKVSRGQRAHGGHASWSSPACTGAVRAAKPSTYQTGPQEHSVKLRRSDLARDSAGADPGRPPTRTPRGIVSSLTCRDTCPQTSILAPNSSKHIHRFPRQRLRFFSSGFWNLFCYE